MWAHWHQKFRVDGHGSHGSKNGVQQNASSQRQKLETRVVAEVDAVSSEKEAGAAMGVNNEQHGQCLMSRDPL
jgi:hypothetical protein